MDDSDLTFILVSTPSSRLSHHGHILLLLSPFIEGLLGGWSTLQATASAYVSDCTSDGSRSHIFSKFIGVFYLGFALGPTVGAYFIRHPLPMFVESSTDTHVSSVVKQGVQGMKGMVEMLAAPIPGKVGVPNVTSVFWVAITCSFVNLVFAMFFLPESLDKAKRKAATKARAAEEAEEEARAQLLIGEPTILEEDEIAVEGAPKSKSRSVSQRANVSVPRSKGKGKGKARSLDANGQDAGGSGLKKLFGPLAIFAPKKVLRADGRSTRTDWSLTMLAGSLALYLLSSVSLPPLLPHIVVLSISLLRGGADQAGLGCCRVFSRSSICTRHTSLGGVPSR